MAQGTEQKGAELPPLLIRLLHVILLEQPRKETLRQVLRVLREGGAAMDYFYLVLPEGALWLYPGVGCTPPDYDPRIRPYYLLAAGKHGKRWGNPYVDSSTDEEGDDLVLPCAMALWGEGGRELGVAVVELIFDKIIRTLLLLPLLPGVRETSLLDADGRVIVDSRDLERRFRNRELDRGLDLPAYPVAAVVENVRARRSGYVVEGARLFAFTRLDVLGWSYVVEADVAAVLDGSEER